MSQMMQEYDAIYREDRSSPFLNEGLVGIRYRLSRYVSLLLRIYSGRRPLSVLKLGGGNGEMFDLMMKQHLDFIKDYIVVEYSPTALEHMNRKGIPASRRSRLFLKEQIGFVKTVGVRLIIVGVVFVGLGN